MCKIKGVVVYAVICESTLCLQILMSVLTVLLCASKAVRISTVAITARVVRGTNWTALTTAQVRVS